MLTKQQRDKWAEELRSGRWEQCRGSYRDSGTKRCCLGVLVDLLNPGVAEDVEYQNRTDAILGWDLRTRFATMNDSLGMTFPQIADEVDKLEVSDQ